MTSTVIKGKVLASDLNYFDGVNSNVLRRDQTGGTISSLPIGESVDVLMAYGTGTEYTSGTINDCIKKIGTTNKRTLIFRPGTWTITENVTFTSNLTCKIPAGCLFSIASGITVTFNGPIDAPQVYWISNSGTVTVSNNLPIYIQWFGVTCDGTTDDTAALQKALDVAGTIAGFSGTILVSKAGTVTYRSVAHNYCLKIKSNSRLIFDPGCTIKLASAANAHVFTNNDIDGAGNTNIHLIGSGRVTIDCNQANQSTPATGEQSGGLFHTITGFSIEKFNLTNVREYALRITGITRGDFKDLYCSDSDGSGFAFGLDIAGYEMTDCYFDNIFAENCLGGFAGAVGNGFVFMGDYCDIGLVRQNACAFGIKIQDTSSYTNIESLISKGTTGDSGVKITGTNSSGRVNHINIGRIISKNNYLTGAYLENVSDINIGEINSDSDSTAGTQPAVWLGEGLRFNVGQIICNTSGAGGVNIRPDNSYSTIGQIISRNSSTVAASQANVLWQGTNASIGEIISVDDQGSPTVDRGVNITSDATNGYCGSVKTNGSFLTVSVITASTTVLIKDHQYGGARVKTWTSLDATPAVSDMFQVYMTANAGATTITTFDNGTTGQEFTVIFNDNNTTVDFTGTNIKGNVGVDKTAATGDHMTCRFDGTNYYCMFSDNTA